MAKQPDGCTKPLRVLVVDDEPFVSDSIKTILRFDGHQVEVVASGEEALAFLKQDHFNLVILDYNLPGMRGDQLAAEIKTQNRNLPVILISGAIESLPATCRDLMTVDAVLGKPFSLDDFRNAIRKVVGH